MTVHESPRICIFRQHGQIVAVGTGTAMTGHGDFLGDTPYDRLRDFRVTEVVIPTDDPRFPYWNGLVDKRLQAAEVLA